MMLGLSFWQWYFVGAALSFVPIVRIIYAAAENDLPSDDGFERGMTCILCVLIGLVGAVFWITVVVVVAFRRVLFPKTARQHEAELKARERRVHEREERIAQLEREAGIG